MRRKVISPTEFPAASRYPKGVVLLLYGATNSSANLNENFVIDIPYFYNCSNTPQRVSYCDAFDPTMHLLTLWSALTRDKRVNSLLISLFYPNKSFVMVHNAFV